MEQKGYYYKGVATHCGNPQIKKKETSIFDFGIENRNMNAFSVAHGC
jgi:hypothetical protein